MFTQFQYTSLSSKEKHKETLHMFFIVCFIYLLIHILHVFNLKVSLHYFLLLLELKMTSVEIVF